MLDRRPFWGLIIWLNLCVVIWLVTIQEPVMPEAEAASASAALYRLTTTTLGGAQQTSANGSSHQQQHASNKQPNQIHDPSRQSKYISLNSSLISLEKATAASAALADVDDDASQLIDLHNFDYLMQQPPCDSHIQALILVHTAPCNADKRLFIRQTWGNQQLLGNSPLRLVFLLGALSGRQRELQQLLAQENDHYRDMVQGNFQDAYRNMTYKHVMALKWFHKHCAQAQLLIKVDDDVFVNTPQLLKYMREPNTSTAPMAENGTAVTGNNTLRVLLQRHSDLLLCREVVKAPVKRSWRSKWRVSFKDYPEHYYPPYCPGFAIIYSADVVQRLYQAAQQAPYFWVDDVQITGVLARQTNTSITTLQPWVLYEGTCKRLLLGQLELDQVEFLVSWHSVTLPQLGALWQLYEEQNDTSSSNADNIDVS